MTQPDKCSFCGAAPCYEIQISQLQARIAKLETVAREAKRFEKDLQTVLEIWANNRCESEMDEPMLKLTATKLVMNATLDALETSDEKLP